MAINYGGWPYSQHAMDMRGTRTATGNERYSIVYPRLKFTFLVEFFITTDVFSNNSTQTDLQEYWKNGRLLSTLRSIDHPQPTFNVERIRSYNKYVLLPKKVEFPSANISFHDDNTSIALGLWKEYLNYYNYSGSVGKDSVASGQPDKVMTDEFRNSNDLVGGNMRNGISIRPSMGMKVRSNQGRNFFDAIRIYDLGSDPDSINVYTYINPVITAMAHDSLDFGDNSAVGVSFTFEYENYYHLVGLSNNDFTDAITGRYGGTKTSAKPRVGGHIRMNQSPTQANEFQQAVGLTMDISTARDTLAGIIGTIRDTLTFKTKTGATTTLPSVPANGSDITVSRLPPYNPLPASIRDAVQKANNANITTNIGTATVSGNGIQLDGASTSNGNTTKSFGYTIKNAPNDGSSVIIPPKALPYFKQHNGAFPVNPTIPNSYSKRVRPITSTNPIGTNGNTDQSAESITNSTRKLK